MNSKLVQNIRYLMRINDIRSGTELARRAGALQSTVHRIMTGQVDDPKISNLRQIAKVLGVPYWMLLEVDCEAEGITRLDTRTWIRDQMDRYKTRNHAADTLRLRSAIEMAINAIRMYKGGKLPTAEEIARAASTIYASSLNCNEARQANDQIIESIIQASVSE